MKFSIIIPSYNQAAYIRSTLESVLDQDGPDREVIVYDGGSQDGTLQILESFTDRVRWISEKDQGQTHAINKGLMEARGDILAYLNSDDIYYPGALQQVADCFETHPEVKIIYGNAQHIDGQGNQLAPYPTEPWNYHRLAQTCYICQPAVFWQRQIIQQFGLFDQNLQYAMDYDYWLRVGNRLPFYHLDTAPLAGSRLHADTKTLGQRVAVHREILQVVQRHRADDPAQIGWLRHLAYYEAQDECLVDATDRVVPEEGRRFAWRFASSVLRRASEFGIPLTVQAVNQLWGEAENAGIVRKSANPCSK